MNGDIYAQIVYLGLILAAVTGWVMVEYRQRMGQALRVLLAWGMIFIGLAAGYGLWHDLRRDILPDQMVEASRVVIPRAQDGHYYLRVEVNGKDIAFMVDTGASNIVLSPSDAQALGIDTSTLEYFGEADTANGVVRTARIVLDKVKLGPFQDQAVRAYVNQADMQGSLLGMDYLGLFSISIQGDEMILTR
jgi:aspartyl protease family protein